MPGHPSRRALLRAAALTPPLAALTGCTRTGNRDLPERAVLFVGNSFTAMNGGLAQRLAGLAPNTDADLVAPGGMTLAGHADQRPTADALGPGRWRLVVLQEQSQVPVRANGLFQQGARTMVARVRAAGALPLLLATWGRPDSPDVTNESIEGAYQQVAAALQVTVVPAGRAFGISARTRPAVALNAADGHPTEAGSYLAACACYSVIFGMSPVGNTFHGGLDDETAAHLQRAAALATGR